MDNNIHHILDPITPKKFFTEYWNKKHLVIRRNKFKNIFTWNDFDIYMNRFPRVSNLQVIDYDAKVQFCNNDWTYKHEIGDLRKQTLKEIWLSEEMRQFRKLLSNGEREKIKIG